MMTPESCFITDLQIREALLPFGLSPDDNQVHKIREYIALLLQWNRSLNLTSITTAIDVVGRHFGESMYIGKILPVDKCRLVDIGTGAGFPGLALKIAYPSLKVDLVESNKKKSVFLAEVIRSLELEDVDIYANRYEEMRPEAFSADVITCRAVGNFKGVLRWSSDALSDGGHLVLWVGAEDSTQIMQIAGWLWQPPHHLPESQRRLLLIGRPIPKMVMPQ